MAKKKVKKRKLKFKSFLRFIIFLALISLFVMYLYNTKINSIVVKGNSLYSDWEIIKLAGLDKRPSTMKMFSSQISNKLEDTPYINKAKVKKEWFTEVTIEVEENLPLFYYVPNSKTVLSNGTEVEDNFPVPTLINYVPNKIYAEFLKEMNDTDYGIVKRMSEIKYDPNDVDEERFLITMNDGNYVYLTLNKFNKINHYLEIIKEFDNKKGILYLDSGEYFKVFE
ncbi:MAG: FtsQ-type POTRA domain-containing protein [Bacilli bacterium]|nr:FtsQ-type POTRA domain-containing protein [Bacilli bacterium]